jgi:Na+-translocating ferredoxin:NAD+ oxidoreductase subunit A
MATLLIILLSAVLIQGSTMVSGSRAGVVPHARGAFKDEFPNIGHFVITLTLTTLLGYCCARLWLPYLHGEYLLTPTLLLGVAGIHALVQYLLKPAQPENALAQLTTQCALLGMALFSAQHADDGLDAIAYGVGAALTLALLGGCYDALRERLEMNDVPVAFRGIPAALITAGFIALALMGFVGMVRH